MTLIKQNINTNTTQHISTDKLYLKNEIEKSQK